MPNKFDSGPAIIPVLHPSGEVHNIEVPPDMPLADLHASLENYYQPAQPTREGAIENSPAFRQAAKEAWAKTQYGNRPEEAAFAVNKQGQTSPIGVTEITPGRQYAGSGRIPISGNTFATLHTHPSNPRNIDPRPSDVDVASAQTTGLPTYVASKEGLFMIRPSDGKVIQVFTNDDWASKTPKEPRK